MKSINLIQGKIALVSDEDYEMISQYKWHYSKRGYAFRRFSHNGESFLKPMHRFILESRLGRKLLSSEQCDHINHDRLDNRFENLRIVTNQENCFNTSKPKRNCSSKYKGVCYVTNSYTRKDGSISEYSYWVAYIKKDGKRYHLGTLTQK